MTYFTWCLPALTVIGLIATGRVSAFVAATLGMVIALAVALTTAPHPFTMSDAALSLMRGAWTAWIVIPWWRRLNRVWDAVVSST